jgi:DNA polymerase-1
MIRIHREVLPRFPESHMILQVHDELVFEAPQEEVEELGRAVREAMRGAMALDVPVEVEVRAGPNWRDLEPV